MKPRLAILISGRGSNMKALAEACNDGRLMADIDIVLSDRDGIEGLKTAGTFGIVSQVLSYKKLGKELAEEKLIKVIKERDIDWIVLAGFMRILSPHFVNTFSDRIINIHPSLLPAFPGQNAIQKAYNYGVKLAGVTVHLVDSEVDHGPILAQSAIEIAPGTTLEELEEQIHRLEHELYWRTLNELFKKT